MTELVDQIIASLQTEGQRSYGERLTILEHSLQSAWFAQQDGASETLVLASLLHDYGHLLHGLGEDIADRGIDAAHEEIGANYLSQHFPETISEPIRLHVAAKRYLCATDPDYHGQLSEASLQSLALQGGPMTDAEVRSWQAKPHFEDALKLRRYDDEGKVPELEVPNLESYRPLLENHLSPTGMTETLLPTP